MAVFSVQAIGLQALTRSLKSARNLSRVARTMDVLVQEVAGEAKRHVRGSRATNPPEMLGVDTGRLRQSIRGRVESKRDELVGIVGPQRVVYAAIHELGGQAGRGRSVTIPARPYLSVALAAKQRRIVEALGDAYVAALRTTVRGES